MSTKRGGREAIERRKAAASQLFDISASPAAITEGEGSAGREIRTAAIRAVLMQRAEQGAIRRAVSEPRDC